MYVTAILDPRRPKNLRNDLVSCAFLFFRLIFIQVRKNSRRGFDKPFKFEVIQSIGCSDISVLNCKKVQENAVQF